MIPKNRSVLRWPPKLSTKTSYPKNINFSEPPPPPPPQNKKNTEIQDFDPPPQMDQAYVYIWKYQSTPSPPPGGSAYKFYSRRVLSIGLKIAYSGNAPFCSRQWDVERKWKVRLNYLFVRSLWQLSFNNDDLYNLHFDNHTAHWQGISDLSKYMFCLTLYIYITVQ